MADETMFDFNDNLVKVSDLAVDALESGENAINFSDEEWAQAITRIFATLDQRCELRQRQATANRVAWNIMLENAKPYSPRLKRIAKLAGKFVRYYARKLRSL